MPFRYLFLVGSILVLPNNAKSVYISVMETYKEVLAEYLKANSETELASTVACSQATINRYRNGKRFPDADTARKIDAASSGEVAFAVWRADFMKRSGIAA